MKKKGFTLIELLAVILILGIIALIAIPTVSNIIKQAKKGAFETTASNLIQAVSDANSLQQLTNETLTKTYTITDGEISPSLNIKGKLPENGSLVVNNQGEVSLAIYDGKYCAEKSYTSNEITVSEKTAENCTIPITVVSMHRRMSSVNIACNPNETISPCLGEILLFSFNYAPTGYLKANGQILAINANPALYSLFGTAYGGNGTTTFAVPNLTSNAPVAGVNYYVTNDPVNYPGEVSITPTLSNGYNYFTYETTYKDFFIGEIRLAANVNEADNDMLLCDGRTLPISQYLALYSLFGTAYGGNGTTTFVLPNLSNVTSPVAGMKYYIFTDGKYPLRP